MRVKRHLLSAILLACLAYNVFQASYIHAKAHLAQYLIASAWQATLTNQQAAPPWPWADTYPVAKLSVPRLAIEQFVLAGTTGSSLAFGPGWMLASDKLGEGSSIVAGHRDTHFSFLKDIRRGDNIQLRLPNGSIVLYEVTEYYVADSAKNDIALTQDTNSLQLITCYPFDRIFRGTLRFVVSAKRMV